MKNILFVIITGFVVFCGWLAHPACGGDANSPTKETPQLKAADTIRFGVDNALDRSITLGSVDRKSGFKFRVELSSKGAAIRKASLSEFDDGNYKDPQPLVILSPVQEKDGSEVLAMANGSFIFVGPQLQLPLDRLHWKGFDVEKGADGSQTARFEAIIKDENTGSPAIKLTKTYKVTPDSYLLDCQLTIENLTDTEQKVQLNFVGPVGIGPEGVGTDTRKVVAGFRDSQGQPAEGGSEQAGLRPVVSVRFDIKKLNKAKSVEDRQLVRGGAGFLWGAIVNKYFAAIVVSVADEGKDYCDWVTDKTGRFYNPDGDSRADSGDETVGLDLKTAPVTLGPAGQPNSSKTYNFKLYLGPKDKSLFDKSELYRKLGFVQTIDFMACCCPTSIINPLAFGILAIMKWMYGFIGNYGVVIIIFVFLVRLAMHPITKMSQVSMNKFSKLAPKAEEIKKKYADNKAELNKQLMALYREQGASPIMGFLPMMVQMPIWIALYSAIYASIELRGAPFLPFWITDLSAQDAVVRFSTITVPLFSWKINSLNLLPIMMGVAFYLQQKLTPSQAPTAASPQAAQQQKMMMVMMTLLFPLMLYRAPSGLNLYIMASTFAGVIEQYVIRKHIRKKEEAESKGLVATTSKMGGKAKKKKPKPFFRF